MAHPSKHGDTSTQRAVDSQVAVGKLVLAGAPALGLEINLKKDAAASASPRDTMVEQRPRIRCSYLTAGIQIVSAIASGAPASGSSAQSTPSQSPHGGLQSPRRFGRPGNFDMQTVGGASASGLEINTIPVTSSKMLLSRGNTTEEPPSRGTKDDKETPTRPRMVRRRVSIDAPTIRGGTPSGVPSPRRARTAVLEPSDSLNVKDLVSARRPHTARRGSLELPAPSAPAGISQSSTADPTSTYLRRSRSLGNREEVPHSASESIKFRPSSGSKVSPLEPTAPPLPSQSSSYHRRQSGPVRTEPTEISLSPMVVGLDLNHEAQDVKAREQLLFMCWDRDFDGKISRKDLEQFMRFATSGVATNAVIGQLMRVADTNHDGAIGFREFQRWLHDTNGGILRGQIKPRNHDAIQIPGVRQALATLFQLHDVNCDGFISAEEFESAYEVYMENVTPEHILEDFRNFDHDGDRRISWHEFLAEHTRLLNGMPRPDCEIIGLLEERIRKVTTHRKEMIRSMLCRSDTKAQDVKAHDAATLPPLK